MHRTEVDLFYSVNPVALTYECPFQRKSSSVVIISHGDQNCAAISRNTKCMYDGGSLVKSVCGVLNRF